MPLIVAELFRMDLGVNWNLWFARQGVYCQFVVERRTHEVVGSLAAGKKIKRRERNREGLDFVGFSLGYKK